MIKNLSSWFPNNKVVGLADQILVSGGNFLTVAICAHTLSLAEQGEFTYVLASYMALLLINISCVFQGAAVRAPAQDHSVYKTILARLQMLQAFALAALVGCFWLSAKNLFGWQTSSEVLALIVAFLVSQQLADFSRRSAYIFARARQALLFSVLLYPTRIIGLLIAQPNSIKQVLVILVASALVPAAFAVFSALHAKVNAKAWFRSVTEHLAYSRLFILGAPLGWLWSYLPILMLGFINGKEQAAILGSIRGISNMANVFMEQLETQVIADWARIHHSDGKGMLEGAVSRLYRLGIALWLIGMTTILFLGQEIVDLLLGKLYAPHWKLLVIVWIAYGLYFLARVYGIKHRTLGLNQTEFIGNLCGVMVALAAGLVMIPRLEATGAAMVYVVIPLGMLIGQKWVMRKSI